MLYIKKIINIYNSPENQSNIHSNKTSRIPSIDCLRGIVAVIMALDHIRSTIHNVYYSPTDLTQTSAFLFMTRWITHFCAPIFIFLAGISVFLALQKGKTKKQMSKYLFKRGIMLIVLDITFVSIVMTGSLSNIYLQVLWVIGISMIILSGLIWLKDKYILALSFIMIIGHNLLDSINIQQSNVLSFIWSLLHSPQHFLLPVNFNIYVKYPIIPWIGVMALGFVFGKLMLIEKEKRSQIMIKIGIATIFSFFLIRGLNIYGDPSPWEVQKNYIFTILSFINCEKYPSSLSYLLMTLGPGILLLGLLDKKIPNIFRPVIVFGKEPLRYYTLHMMMIGIFMALNVFIVFVLNMGQMPSGDYIHHSLKIVYLEWVCMVIILYWFFVKKTSARRF